MYRYLTALLCFTFLPLAQADAFVRTAAADIKSESGFAVADVQYDASGKIGKTSWRNSGLTAKEFAKVKKQNPLPARLKLEERDTESYEFRRLVSQKVEEKCAAANPEQFEYDGYFRMTAPVADKKLAECMKREAARARALPEIRYYQPYRAGQFYVFPKKQLVRIPTPPYPPLSMENGDEGTVILVFSLKKDQDAEIRILKSSGHYRLDHAAQKGLRAWLGQAKIKLNPESNYYTSVDWRIEN